jgi:chemotaxis signal transduction protein
MTDQSRLAVTALELRNAFDQVYALPPLSLDSEHTENLLAIRLAGDSYAIRVSEIAGLASDREVIVLPSPIPELLGVAGIRGGLVPVYSLAALVGHNRDGNHARWLALYGTEDPVGLAFSDFEGYLKVPSAQIYKAGQNHAIREHVRDLVRTADVVRAIVNIPSVVETIKRRCGEGRVSKER